ncbi:MAG TPA: tyrosine-type recombinase/integrase [Candidatus Dormibacteraeota bacterium]
MTIARHPGTIERRGGSHRVILYAGGRRYTFTLPTADRREAVAFARRKHGELAQQVGAERRSILGPVRFSDLASRFEMDLLPTKAPGTQRTYRYSLAAFRAFFVGVLGDPQIEKLHEGHVREFLTWRRTYRPAGNPEKPGGNRRTAPAANRTIEKERAVLHTLFALAVELNVRLTNPVAKVAGPDVDTRDPVLLTDPQYEQLLEACDRVERPMLWLYALTLGETGARCESEVLWLRWEDVDFEDGFLQILSGRDGHRTKGGKGRFVPMTSRLRTAMREHALRFRGAQYDGRPSPWVFHHELSRRHAKAGARVQTFRGGFDAAAARAGLPAELHQHDLRHRRVTSWLAEGKSAVLVKEAVGHADLRTTMGYTHLAKEHLRALVGDGKDVGRSEQNGTQKSA